MFLPLVSAAAVALPTFALLDENQSPFCNDGGTISVPCQGATTTVTLSTDAYDPDGDPLTYQWLACPGAFLTDPTSPTTDLILDTYDSCNVNCGVRLRLTDPFGAHYVCRLYVAVTPGVEGCTPGFWKNHAQAWHDSGFLPIDDFDVVFGVDAFSPNRTLMQALWSGGGGINKLARHGTAALLNAADVDVHFALSQGEVIDLVHDAIVNKQYEPLATQLDLLNNGGCPQSSTNY
ncbi:MAG: hypothetical protein IT454_18315 [Planctomycetes bacterium]|nr:hypothetical protein [Planctomycetota bacterium]